MTMVRNFYRANADYGARLAKALGIELDQVKQVAMGSLRTNEDFIFKTSSRGRCRSGLDLGELFMHDSSILCVRR
jgi:hypothetical protein